MNIFKQEFKSNLTSTMIWTASISLFVLFMMSMYPGFAEDAEGVKKLFSGVPESIREAMDLDIDLFLSLLGFYSFSFLYILLMGAIQAMNLGLSMLSKETRDKTADFLLTKPVTRTTIVSGKLLAAFVSIIITNIVFIVVSYIAVEMVKKDDYQANILIMVAVTLLFIQLIFLALGFIMSVLIRKIKSVVSISLPTVFGFFIVGMLGSVIGDKAVRYITPFEYFDREYIIRHGRFELRYIILELVIIIISIGATYIIYHNKDIHSI